MTKSKTNLHDSAYDEDSLPIIAQELITIVQPCNPKATIEDAVSFLKAFDEGYNKKTVFGRRFTSAQSFVASATEAISSKDRHARNKITEKSQRWRCKHELYNLLGLPPPKPYSQEKTEKYSDVLALVAANLKKNKGMKTLEDLRDINKTLYSRVIHYGWGEKIRLELGLPKYRGHADLEFLYELVRKNKITDWSDIQEKHPEVFQWAKKQTVIELITEDLNLTDSNFIVTVYLDVDSALDYIKRFKIASYAECKEHHFHFINKVRYSGILIELGEKLGWTDHLTKEESRVLDIIKNNSLKTPDDVMKYDPILFSWIKRKSSFSVMLSMHRPNFEPKYVDFDYKSVLFKIESEIRQRKIVSMNQFRTVMRKQYEEALELKLCPHIAYRLGLKHESEIPSEDLIDRAIEACGGDLELLAEEEPFLFALVRKRGLLLNVSINSAAD
jgi:hypothetical protein